MLFTGNPADHVLWVTEQLGEGMMEILRERRNSIYKLAKGEEKEIAAHYRNELKTMEAKRADGETGRIEFLSWY